MSKTGKATLAGLVGNSIFGFSFLFSKIALDVAKPFVLLSVRFLMAFLVLNLLVLTGRQKLDLKGKPTGELLLLGLVQPVFYFICESYGITMTSSAFAGVMLGLVPVIGLVLGRVMLKEPCTLRQAVCAVISILGVLLTTAGGMGNFSPLGTLLLAGAAVSASLFTAISRSAAERFTAFERTYVMFALGGTVFTAIALAQNWGDWDAFRVPFSVPGFWVSAAYLAVISSVVAFLLLNYAMNDLSVGKAAIFANFATVISILAGILIMKDEFTPLQLVGVVIIVISVFGVSYQKDPAPAEK